MFAGEPPARAPQAGINLVEDKQRFVLVTEAPEQWQKGGWRNADASASLHRFSENRADAVLTNQTANGVLRGIQTLLVFAALNRKANVGRERSEMSKPAQLRSKGRSKEIAVGGIQGSITEAVISAGKGDYSGFACRQERGFQGRFHRLKP